MRASLDRTELWTAPLLLLAAGFAVPFLPTRWLPIAAAAAAGAFVLVRFVGARTAVLALGVCFVPPGVIGEASSLVSIALLLVITAVLLNAPRERTEGELPLALILALIGIAFVMTGHASRSYTAIGAIYIAAAVVAWQFSLRPSLSRRVISIVATLAAAECASYWVSYVTGFRGGPHLVALKTRQVGIYPPFTVTAGHQGFWSPHPRLAMFSGEAGLGAIVLLAGLAYTLKYEEGRKRFILATLLASGVFAGQSSAAAIAACVLVAIAVCVNLTRKLTLLAAAIFGAAAVALIVRLSTHFVHAKLAANSASVADRGLLIPGNFAGDISLHAAFVNHPTIAVPVIALLAYLAWRSLRDPFGLGLIAAIAVIAWYAQPLQDHPGVWLLALLTGGARHFATQPVPDSLT
jgi:hypothetical protein